MSRQRRVRPVIETSLNALTIHDYANSAKPPRRLRKAHAKNTVDARDQATKAAAADDEAAINDDHLDEDDTTAAGRSSRSSRRSRRAQAAENGAEDDLPQYASYNDDIWFAIGRHVAAEDVGRFALINRQTADVCRTASFWTHLYRREYRAHDTKGRTNPDTIPERLRPGCMDRLCGLRTCTIRALFYCNATLRARLQPQLSAGGQQSTSSSVFDLVRRECVGAWMVAGGEKNVGWWHCYRLKRRLPAGSRMAESEAVRKRNRFASVYRDIYQNPDESCALLAVRMATVRPLPQLFGQASYLTELRHNLSGRGCTEYRLTLQFSSGCGTASGALDVLAHVVYDPVAEVRMLDWWTPEYHEFVERGRDDQ